MAKTCKMVSYGGQKRANVNSSPKQMVSHLASGQLDSENKENAGKIENVIQDIYSSILGENQTWTHPWNFIKAMLIKPKSPEQIPCMA